jgi:aspartate beta-hydroxylase
VPLPFSFPVSCNGEILELTAPLFSPPGFIFSVVDAYDHETWHNGPTNASERVVLLFDTWHPDLVKEEKRAIVDMFDYARKQEWLKTQKA